MDFLVSALLGVSQSCRPSVVENERLHFDGAGIVGVLRNGVCLGLDRVEERNEGFERDVVERRYLRQATI